MLSALVWGCDPKFQYESSWIKLLLSGLYDLEIHLYDNLDLVSQLLPYDHIFLVESGLNRLRKSISNQELSHHDSNRLFRINSLSDFRITLIHLSDEEGNDADSFYSSLQD